MARIRHKEPIHLGLDVHRDTISVATLPPDRATAAVNRSPATRQRCWRSSAREQPATRSRPTGATAGGWRGCTAPASWSPSASLNRMRRRSGICAGPGPTWTGDHSRARRRLQAFLLCHGRLYRAGACWTGKHQRWLGTRRFDDPQLQATFTRYRAMAATRDAQVTAIEADLAGAAMKPPFADAVARLAAYRGVGSAGRPVAGRRGRRLAAVRARGRVHGLHRASAQ
jgi:hypothetical protein